VALKQRDKPTFFELMTAMAFKYFADEAVDRSPGSARP